MFRVSLRLSLRTHVKAVGPRRLCAKRSLQLFVELVRYKTLAGPVNGFAQQTVASVKKSVSFKSALSVMKFPHLHKRFSGAEFLIGTQLFA